MQNSCAISRRRCARSTGAARRPDPRAARRVEMEYYGGVGRVLGLAIRGMIRAYQLLVAPVLGPSCRYYPSCSHYAEEAVGRYGPWRGSLLALRRLSRCHPWGGSGYDPVPAEPQRYAPPQRGKGSV